MKLIPKTVLQYFFIGSVCYLSFTAQSKAQGISISPARIFFTGSSEHKYIRRITIENSSAEAVIFKSSLKDWKRDSVGNKIYFPTGELPLSNASWVEVLPNVVEIAPHSTGEVSVVLHVPEGLSTKPEVSNSMLFLTQLNAQKSSSTKGAKTNIGVMVKLEFGIHVYFTPQMTTVKDLEFLAFTSEDQVNQGMASFHRVAIKVKNTGNVVTDGFLRLELTDKVSGKEFKLPERAISMLPNDEQIIYIDLPESLKGTFLAIALMDSGEETNLKVAKKDLILN